MSVPCFRLRVDAFIVILFWSITITILSLNSPIVHSFSISHRNKHASTIRPIKMNNLQIEYRYQSPKIHESLLKTRKSLQLIIPVPTRTLFISSSLARCRASTSILYAESHSSTPEPSSNILVVPMNMKVPNEDIVNQSSTDIIPSINEIQDIQMDQMPPKSRDSSKSITLKDKLIIGSATSTLLVAFLGLLSAAGPGGWRYYLAGGVCAALSHAVATPIDVVKVRVYASSGMYVATEFKCILP
jgi:hypothetical protein